MTSDTSDAGSPRLCLRWRVDTNARPSATEHDLPLLTRNASEFRRVAGLKVVDYTVAG